MTAHADYSGLDPRLALSANDLASRRALPAVARPGGGGDGLALVAGGLGALALGALTLVGLAHDRKAPPPMPAPAVALRPAAVAAAPAAPTPVPVVAPIAAAPAPAPGTALDPNQSRANPMIVDNTGGGSVEPGRPAGAAPAAGPQASALLSADEQFSARVGGDGAAAHAVGLGDPATAVVQGTIIPAVLETALNSDLPGYARAIVSRDVRGFDGARVVIPRGSRLIGQYKSGLATGQSRAFIVWTRLIRPDGVSVQLGSPVMDEAGQIGLSGRVDRHFLQRYGAAAMLSVVGGLAGALGDGSDTLVIGTSSQAQSAAAQALQTDGKIGPTIRIPQGTPIQVFTARDLDFSGA